MTYDDMSYVDTDDTGKWVSSCLLRLGTYAYYNSVLAQLVYRSSETPDNLYFIIKPLWLIYDKTFL
jgi:hypothetical protein